VFGIPSVQRAVVPTGRKLPEGLKPIFNARLEQALRIVEGLVPVMFQRRHT
jgi:hypothetical protein